MTGPDEEWISRTIERLGRPYKPAVLPADLKVGKLGDCFDSAAVQAAMSKGKYIYVEGAAQDPQKPDDFILHAWLTDANGKYAYDPTWRAEDKITQELKPLPIIYIGIPIDIYDVREWLNATEYKSILGNAWRNPKLAKKILERSK